MIKAIIFDMDGVIIDSEPVYDEWLKLFLEESHVEVSDEERKSLHGLSFNELQEIFKNWWHRSGYTNITAEAIGEKFLAVVKVLEEYSPISYGELKDPNIKELMRDLKYDDFKIAIASSSPSSHVEKAMDEIGLREYVDLYVSGDMLERGKPDPEIYLHTMEALGVKPDECIVVEDSEYGIRSAKKAKLFVIAKEDKRFGFDQSLADAKVKSLKELPGRIRLQNTRCKLRK